MEVRATVRYPSRGFSSGDDEATDDGSRVIGPVSVDGLEVVDEQVVPLAPADAPGRRRRQEYDRAVG